MIDSPLHALHEEALSKTFDQKAFEISLFFFFSSLLFVLQQGLQVRVHCTRQR